MNQRRLILILTLIIIGLYIYLNQHFFYCLFIYKTKNIIWLLQNNRIKNGKKTVNDIKNNGIYNVIQKKTEFQAPLFDKVDILREFEMLSNPLFLSKKNSLAETLNIITTPHNLFGQWKADSIFRMNYYDRGHDNYLKKRYLSALTVDKNEKYRETIRAYFKKAFFNLFHFAKHLSQKRFVNFVYKSTLELTYLLHFNKKPNHKTIKYIYQFVKSITKTTTSISNSNLIRHVYNLKFLHRDIIEMVREVSRERSDNCIVYHWLQNGFSLEEVYIEFIHNIVGVTLNWFYLMYGYILGIGNKSIPMITMENEDEKNKYLFESMRFVCPVKMIISSYTHNYKRGAVHDIYTISRNNDLFGKNTNTFNSERFNDYKKDMSQMCPFMRDKPLNTLTTQKSKATVQCGFSILEKDGYINFGSGYRRCPGELLTLTFLEELANIANDYPIQLYLKDGVSIKENFVFDRIEVNYFFK